MIPFGLSETLYNKHKLLRKHSIKDSELEELLAEMFPEGPEQISLPPIVAPDLGEIVKARVVSIREDYFTLDFGYKSEGFLPAQEEDGYSNTDLDVGDEIQVMVDQISADDVYWFSKKAVEEHLQQQSFLSSLQVGRRLEATVESQSRSGLIFSLFPGVFGKLSASQAGMHPAALEAEDWLGRTLEVEVLSISDDDGIELTRKQIVEEARRNAKENFLANLETGLVVDGTVKSIAEFGLFIQIAPGIVGLCHNSDKLPEENYTPGQKVKAKVLRFDRAKNRVSLGIRQVNEPSWEEILERYPVGAQVTGEVKSLAPYGAFVELETGVQGLVHVSDLSWSEHVKHPKEVLDVGNQIEVQILELDSEKQRISLGLKQTKPDPWTTVESKYLIGSVVPGVVTSRTDFGTFVALEDSVEGLLQEKSVRLAAGSSVMVKITRLDPKTRRIGLSLSTTN